LTGTSNSSSSYIVLGDHDTTKFVDLTDQSISDVSTDADDVSLIALTAIGDDSYAVIGARDGRPVVAIHPLD
jgi:hypothetical protein